MTAQLHAVPLPAPPVSEVDVVLIDAVRKSGWESGEETGTSEVADVQRFSSDVVEPTSDVAEPPSDVAEPVEVPSRSAPTAEPRAEDVPPMALRQDEPDLEPPAPAPVGSSPPVVPRESDSPRAPTVLPSSSASSRGSDRELLTRFLAASRGPSSGEGIGVVSERALAGRDLAAAFVWALPKAAAAERAWAKLPSGTTESIRVRVVLDDAGRLTDLVAPSGCGAHWRGSLDALRVMLSVGRFQESGEPAELQVRADVGFDAQLRNTSYEAHHKMLEASWPAHGGEPGRARFVLASGVAVSFEVQRAEPVTTAR